MGGNMKRINIIISLAIVVLIIGIVLAYNWYVNFPNELAESISIYFNWG